MLSLSRTQTWVRILRLVQRQLLAEFTRMWWEEDMIRFCCTLVISGTGHALQVMLLVTHSYVNVTFFQLCSIGWLHLGSILPYDRALRNQSVRLLAGRDVNVLG